MLPKEAMLPREAVWTRERVAAVAIAAVWVAASLRFDGPEGAFETALYCLVPLLCVWFPEILANRTGFGMLWDGGIPMTRTTPSGIVRLVGWGLLLLPVVLVLVVAWGAR